MYPAAENERRVNHLTLKQLVKDIFMACGMNQEDASVMASLLVAADLRGCHSHGMIRVPEYVEKLQNGGVNPNGKPKMISDKRSAIVVDGDNSMGQICCHFAMQLAIDRARDMGISMVAIQGSNHCGAMADYAMMASQQRMIGLAGTNALPTMAPYGGIDKILGINPLAIAFPASQEPDIVFDAAFSKSSHGKIRVYHQKGYSIPDHWAFNKFGQATNDTSEAIEGLLQPIGGYKGTGLALMIGLLSTMLSQASYGTELGDMKSGPKAGEDGHFCLAINISSFINFELYASRIVGVIQEIRDCRKAPGINSIYVPGGLEAELENEYIREGIPLNQETLHDLAAVTNKLGLSNPEL